MFLLCLFETYSGWLPTSDCWKAARKLLGFSYADTLWTGKVEVTKSNSTSISLQFYIVCVCEDVHVHRVLQPLVLFLRRNLPYLLRLSHRPRVKLGCLVIKHKGLPCACSPSTGITNTRHHSQFLRVGSGDRIHIVQKVCS